VVPDARDGGDGFLEVREKLDVPFGFGGQDEAPVRFANAASFQPQLRGMRLARKW